MKIFKRKQSKTLYINMEIKRKRMNYYWRRFNELVKIAYLYDQNSEEYSKIIKLAWCAFDRWCELFIAGYTEDEK